MTPRRIKIIAVIFGIICLGMFTTLTLRSCLIRSYHAAVGSLGAGMAGNGTAGGAGSWAEAENGQKKSWPEDGADQEVPEEARLDTGSENENPGAPENGEGGQEEAGLVKETEASGRQETESIADSGADTAQAETAGSSDGALSAEASEAQTVESAASEAGSMSGEEWLESLLESESAYMMYLNEVARRVERLYEDAAGKSAAENQEAENYAYQLWDDELNRIYPALREALPEDESEALKLAERQWIKDRDGKAQRDSASAASEAGRQLAYTRSLTVTTRERTYELVQMYFEAAGQPEGK